MKFALGDREVEVALEENEPVRAKHTGRLLRRGHLQFSVQGQEAHASVMGALDDAKKNEGLLVGEADGAEPMRWKVANTSYSYTDRGIHTVYSYDWTIEEQEGPFQIERLRIKELLLEPYAYTEKFDGKDHLTIEARVRLQNEALNRLREHMESGAYYDVVREGINSEPRQMRFTGRQEWSRDGEMCKQQFRLVDRAYDDQPNPFAGLFQPERSNMAQSLAFVREAFEGLLDVLSTKGILAHEELVSLRQAAINRINQRLWLYSEAADIDSVPL